MERTVIAVDIAKKVFQLHWVEMDTGCIERLQLKRARMLVCQSNGCTGRHGSLRRRTRLGPGSDWIGP